jgi:uncharacterized membrane protein YdjX (TVP38/TMEM64 family)
MKPDVAKREVLINFLGLGLILLIFVLGFRYFDIETVRGWIANAGLWAPLILILAKAATLVIAPLGGAFLYPLAGALFGLGKGVTYLMLGEVIGGTISFFLSRTLGRKVVDRFFPSQESVITRALSKLTITKGLLIGRIVFIPYPELFSYIAGLTRARYLPFIAIYTGVGIIPAFAGAALGPVLVQANNWQIAGLVFVVGVVAVSGLYFWFKTLDEPTPPASS